MEQTTSIGDLIVFDHFPVSRYEPPIRHTGIILDIFEKRIGYATSTRIAKMYSVITPTGIMVLYDASIEIIFVNNLEKQ